MRNAPKGWLGCPQHGELIDSIFMPIKTMLDEDKYRVPDRLRFTTEMMMRKMSEENINIGMVINLSQASDRYDEQELTHKYGVQYRQIVCRGLSVPTPHQQNQFIRTCDEFLRMNSGKVIAVHCTHGCNRTGFMICLYLCARGGWPAQEAVTYFASKRPPGIYRQCYIDCLYDLFANWQSREPVPRAAPEPKWEIDEDLPSGDERRETENY